MRPPPPISLTWIKRTRGRRGNLQAVRGSEAAPVRDSSLFAELLVFLLAPVVVVPLFRVLRCSPLLGYLVAGILIGPHALALIRESELTDALAELGVAFLLFAIGLELSLERLRVMRRLVFGLGGLQVRVTGVAIGSVARWTGSELAGAIVIGGALALSSTAFVLQLLVERAEQVSRFGRTAFAILLFQDLAVVPLLALVPMLALDTASLATALGLSALKATVALVSIVIIGRLLLRPAFRIVAATRSRELFVSATLLVVLGTGWVATQAGLSLALGAFLAGLLLSETEYRHQVEADIGPFRGLLLGLFFITVGLAMDLHTIVDHWGAILGLLACLVLGKSAIVLGLCLAFRHSLADAIRIALILAQGGEFAFVLFDAALGHGLLGVEIGQILLATVAASMIVTPLLAEFGRILAERLRQPSHGDLDALQRAAGNQADHVLIAGFGRVGQTVAKVLAAADVPYVALDLNLGRIQRCRLHGLPVFFGDASRVEVLAAAGAGSARAAVLTLDQPAAVERALGALHQHFPALRIFVRGRDPRHGRQLEQRGATAVVPEAVEASLQLGSIVLTAIGGTGDEAARIVEQLRGSGYAALDTVVDEVP
jgi:CPA2 family monovalent cation:H+ antiporter-2